MKKKWIWTAVILLLLAAGGVGGWYYYGLKGHVFQVSDTEYVYVDADDNIDSVKAKIVEAGQPSSLYGFGLSVSKADLEGHVCTGRYAIRSSDSWLSVVRAVKAHRQEALNVVVPSCRLLDDLAGRMTRHLMTDSASLADAIHSDEVCRSFGLDTLTMQCLFIPNTYQVYWDSSVDDLLQRMKKEHDTFWNEERLALAKAIGLTPVEVVTLASIVEGETANDGEKPTVAGLYMNRLHQGMPLQSDPTVIYAVGDFTIRRVLNKHLQYDSPYNTYKYKGLPPGPIRIPSIAGIDAVLHHDHNDYLYMCAKEDFSGTHNFAHTYAEHLANARRYTRALDERGIKK